ncbi:MAG: hypothetical protein ACREMR_04195 [Gemmatimonadales bacterium]
MRGAGRRARVLGRLLVLAGAAACTEQLTAPGVCPDYCPPGQIIVLDTVFRAILGRDSAFRGYVQAHNAGQLLAASLPFRDSRPIFRTLAIPDGFRFGADTTLRPIVGVDSLRMALFLVRRDSGATNLTLRLYRLPLTIDSMTTLTDLAPDFAAAPIRTVNVDSLLGAPGRRNTLTRDSVSVEVGGAITVLVGLDSADAPYVPGDSGRLAFGVTVSADSLANIALGSSEVGNGPRVSWFLRIDSAGVDTIPPIDTVPPVSRTINPIAEFDGFVFDPPALALDSTLAVGGVPAARSIVRADLPQFLRDSAQVLRATLILVPTGPVQGTPSDSFFVAAYGVETDIGAKSPLVADSLRRGSTLVRVGTADTLRIEITGLVQVWVADTTAPTVLMLRQVPEGSTLAEMRFQPSAHATFAPALQVTYARRFPFGVP